MTRPTGILVSAGWLVVFLSCWRVTDTHAGETPAADHWRGGWRASAATSTGSSAPSSERPIDAGFVYRLPYSYTGVVFGGAAVGDTQLQGLLDTGTFLRMAIGHPEFMQLGRWLESDESTSAGLTVGYTWRNVTLESTSFSAADSSAVTQAADRGSFVLSSRVARLSFNPSPNWTLQLSRGLASGLDQLVPGDQVRRTAISATHKLHLSDGDLQTTFAWGRSSRKDREATLGYLLESVYRFGGAQAVFGRIEQVGSDELMRENEALQRQFFKMNRLTVGYFHEVRASESFRFDIGVFANRHLVPSAMTSRYGDDPTTYMMFIRFKLK